MSEATPKILTLNAGSSSIKFALFTIGAGLQRILSGNIERVDSDASAVRALEEVQKKIGDESVSAVGHRLVHGGPKHFAPEIVSDELIGELRKIAPLDPEHLPREIELI